MWEDAKETIGRGGFRCLYLCSGLMLVFLLQLPLRLHGQTQPSSQSSGQQSSLNGKHLETWEQLSNQFDLLLRTHEETLTELEVKLRTSENSLEQSTLLLETLSAQNAALKNYNQQIAERMQERDEDLAAAYDQIHKDAVTKLRLWITVIVLGVACLAILFILLRV